MNKRIQELAEQAGEYVNSVYTPPVRSKTPGKIWEDGHIGWHEQFHQKFAELIVRECVNEIHDADIGDLKGRGYYLDKVAEHIEKHFGVEESKGWVCPKCGIDRAKEACPNGYHAALTGQCPMYGVAQ
jgi:hypothetical protein